MVYCICYVLLRYTICTIIRCKIISCCWIILYNTTSFRSWTNYTLCMYIGIDIKTDTDLYVGIDIDTDTGRDRDRDRGIATARDRYMYI